MLILEGSLDLIMKKNTHLVQDDASRVITPSVCEQQLTSEMDGVSCALIVGAYFYII